jgi:hypothetical protein
MPKSVRRLSRDDTMANNCLTVQVEQVHGQSLRPD